MARSGRIKDHYAEQDMFVRRTLLAASVIALGIFALVARLVWLQVIQYDYFLGLSQGNRIRIEPLPPNRGLILDRNGVPLALNAPSYQLELTREQVTDLDGTLHALSNLQLLDREDLPALKRDILKRRSFEPVPVKQLDEEELARFAVRRQYFPGVEIRPRLTRYYPLATSSVHALGYVSSISEEDQKKIDMNEYAGTSLIGKAGVEKRYEAELHGKSGYQQMLVNAQGRRVDQAGSRSDLKRREPIAGNDLYLTVDERLQQIAEEMVRDKRAAVIAIDPNNGDVLAFVSTPGFDPNMFARGITRAEYRNFVQDPDKPLIDRVLRGVYPSGSTIKPFMALTALQYGIIEPDDSKFCTGSFRLPGVSRPWRDWKHEGHGNVDMRRAIAVSCDVYFYSVGNVLGVDRMHEFLTQFGFGRTSGIDVDGELKGLLPSTAWKRQAFKRRENQTWYAGDTISVSIGQGYLTVTPMELAQATSLLAMRGKGFQPRLVRSLRNSVTGELTEIPPVPVEPIKTSNEKNWDVIFEGMQAVMKPGGTAYSAFGINPLPPYTAGGKTGTAQVAAMAQGVKYNAKLVQERLRDHGLFIAFAPLEAPKIAIAVVIENGEHGTAGAPIARRIFDRMLLTPEQWGAQEAKRQQQLEKQKQAAGGGTPATAAASGDE